MKQRRKQGVVLITVLWIVLVLALIAWGLGRRSAMETSVLETYEGKVRSYAGARAGVNAVMRLLEKSPSQRDTLYNCGVGLEAGRNPEDVFGHMDVAPGVRVSVEWAAKGYSEAAGTKVRYGLQDEQGKINVNNIDQTNYTILGRLFERRGLGASDALRLARAVMAFKASGETPDGGQRFLDDTADEKAVKPKKRPYQHLSELLNVPGMTEDLLKALKDDLTVYGDPAKGLVVNVRTANNAVLQALVDAAAQGNSGMNGPEVLSRAYAMRDGNDGISFTEDDGKPLESGDRNAVDLAGWPAALQDTNTNFVRVHVVGVDDASRARTELDVVVKLNGGFGQNQIIAWQRD